MTEEQKEPTLEELMARIAELTEKRDTVNEAIKRHKKAAQRLIGRL